MLESLEAAMLKEIATLVALVETQDPLDLPETPDVPETLEDPAVTEIPEPQLHLPAKLSLLHHANPAHKDLPVPLDSLDNPEDPDKMEAPDKEAETHLPDHLDLRDHPVNPVTPEDPDNPETPEHPLKAKELLLDPLDLPVMLELLDNPVTLDSLVTTDSPEAPDLRDHPAHQDNLVNPEVTASQVTPDNLAAQETAVSARNTAPSMVVSSSKMEPDAKKFAQDFYHRTILLLFFLSGCTILPKTKIIIYF